MVITLLFFSQHSGPPLLLQLVSSRSINHDCVSYSARHLIPAHWQLSNLNTSSALNIIIPTLLQHRLCLTTTAGRSETSCQTGKMSSFQFDPFLMIHCILPLHLSRLAYINDIQSSARMLNDQKPKLGSWPRDVLRYMIHSLPWQVKRLVVV